MILRSRKMSWKRGLKAVKTTDCMKKRKPCAKTCPKGAPTALSLGVYGLGERGGDLGGDRGGVSGERRGSFWIFSLSILEFEQTHFFRCNTGVWGLGFGVWGLGFG